MATKNNDKTGFLKPRTDRSMAELAARRNPTRHVDVEGQLARRIEERFENYERCRRLLIHDLQTYASRVGITVPTNVIGDFLEAHSQSVDWNDLLPAFALFIETEHRE